MRTQIELPIKYKRIQKRDNDLGGKQKYILRWAKKIRAIEYRGGQCCKCGEKRPYVLVFHHRDSDVKKDSMQYMMNVQRRWSEIENELDKCDLVCENCHREIHAEQESVDIRHQKNKEICLEFKESFKCIVCDYSKSNWALEFHHNRDKAFGIAKCCSKYSWKSVGDLQKWFIEELNKCDIYCSNCHKEKHFDLKRFEDIKSEIYDKIKNMKEKNPVVNKERVLELIQNGKTITEISKILNCSYIRVYEIARNYGLNSHRKVVDRNLVLKLWEEGNTRKSIMKETGYSKSSMVKILNGKPRRDKAIK